MLTATGSTAPDSQDPERPPPDAGTNPGAAGGCPPEATANLHACTLGALAAAAAMLAVGGCSGGPAGPDPGPASRDTVVLSFTNDTLEVRVLGGQTGRLFGQRTLLGPEVPVGSGFGPTLVADSLRRDVVGALSPNEAFERTRLTAFGVPGLATSRSKRWSEVEAEFNGELRLLRVLGGNSDRLFLLSERTDDNQYGVAVVTQPGWQIAGFVGRFIADAVSGPAEVAPDRGSGDGLLVVGGVRTPEADRLMIYGRRSLDLRDSVFVGQTLDDLSSNLTRLRGLASLGDGRHVVALTLDSLLKVDVRQARVVARRRRVRPGVSGEMAVTPEPPRIFLTDRGDFDHPGSGRLQAYGGEDLADLGTVDLRTDKFRERFGSPFRAPAMNDVAVGDGGDHLFVVAGTGIVGGFGQRASLTVVDVAEMRRVRTQVFDRFSLVGVAAF